MKFVFHACLVIFMTMRANEMYAAPDISESLVIVHTVSTNGKTSLVRDSVGICISKKGYFVTHPIDDDSATITISLPNGESHAAKLCPSAKIKNCSILYCKDLHLKPVILSSKAASPGDSIQLCGYKMNYGITVDETSAQAMSPIPGKIVRPAIGKKLQMISPDFVATSALIPTGMEFNYSSCVIGEKGQVLGVCICINSSRNRSYPYDFGTCYLPLATDAGHIRKIIGKE